MRNTYNRPTSHPQRKKKAKKQRLFRSFILSFFFTLLGFILGIIASNKNNRLSDFKKKGEPDKNTIERLEMLNKASIPSYIDSQIIPIDGVSRDGTLLSGINDIVIHYVANPGTSAQNNHDFYCNEESSVSSHFIVGLEGEIIQCIPLNEMSAASNWRNRDTISIEVCHPDVSGRFNSATYKSLVKLVAWLTTNSGLTTDHIIRHYDITGKECPLYYVEHEDAWEDFLKDVDKAMD